MPLCSTSGSFVPTGTSTCSGFAADAAAGASAAAVAGAAAAGIAGGSAGSGGGTCAEAAAAQPKTAASANEKKDVDRFILPSPAANGSRHLSRHLLRCAG